MKTILITGGAGFIGRNLINYFSEKNYKIILIDNLSSGYNNFSSNKKIIFIKGSINNSNVLSEAFAHKPYYVIHLAALFANQNSVEHPSKDLMTNGIGTIKILEWSKKIGVKKLIYASSSCVYGNKKIMKESDNLMPGTPYAISKLIGEYYSKFWSEYYNLNIIVVRLFNVYGPGDFPGKYRSVVPNFIKSAINKENLNITGTGNETRDFTYIVDVVRIFGKLIKIKSKKFEIINIGSGKPEKIINIAKLINKISNNPKKIIFKKTRKWDDVPYRSADNSKLKKVIKNLKFTSLKQGLEETYKWMQNIPNKF